MRDIDAVVVRIKEERARVYAAGGIGFDQWIDGPGFVVNVAPSVVIIRLALAVRREAYPDLPVLTVADVMGV